MPKRATLKTHLIALKEIANIIGAMKNMALMEIAKVTKFMQTQAKVVTSINAALHDFLFFYPDIVEQFQTPQPKAYIIIGSERGFCGNFNEMLLRKADESVTSDIPVIAVGRKLASKIEDTNITATPLAGANSVEEIQVAVLTLANELENLYKQTQGKIHPGNIAIVFNAETKEAIAPKFSQLFAALQDRPTQQDLTPPLLYLEPQQFLFTIMEQYLLALLFQIFYESFLAENRQRLQHMESALDWLEKKQNELQIYLNRERQEEITEEIELISLSAGMTE